MAELFSISIYTLIITYIGVGNFRSWAAQQLLVLPNERSSHIEPTPSGGGVAIVLSTLLGIILFALLRHDLSPVLWPYCAGAALIALVSWYDDLQMVLSHIRLGVHVIGALLFLVGVDPLVEIELPLIGAISLGWIGFWVSFFWIISLINAYNFMDGIDGLAGSQAVIAGVVWAFLGFIIEDPLIMALGVILAAGSFGFLGYNWPPARIFMGDVGSTFLGYSFGCVTLLAAQHDSRLAVVGLLLLWPFLFDTLFTIARRILRRENILESHRSHLYQRLVIAGYSHRAVTLLYTSFALMGAIAGILWFYEHPVGLVTLVVGVPALIILLWAIVLISEARVVWRSHSPKKLVLKEV